MTLKSQTRVVWGTHMQYKFVGHLRVPCALLGAMERRVNKTKISVNCIVVKNINTPPRMCSIKTVYLTIKTMGMKILFTNMTHIWEDFKSIVCWNRSVKREKKRENSNRQWNHLEFYLQIIEAPHKTLRASDWGLRVSHIKESLRLMRSSTSSSGT